MEKELIPVENVEEHYVVNKSNVLIDAVYSLTALEQKVLLCAIARINPKKDDELTYRISVSSLREILNIDRSNFYKSLKKLTFNILEKPFIYYDTEKDKELQAPWFSSCEYYNKEGYVEFSFSPKVKPLLVDLKKSYTHYLLGYAVQLKSKYSIRMYELLKRVEKLKTATFYISELKRQLGIGKQYPNYPQFKQNVIEVSKREINQFTDIKFSYQAIKQGKKVERIKFIVNENPKTKKINLEKDLFEDNDLTILLKKHGVYPDKIQELIVKYPTDYIYERVNQLEYNISKQSREIQEYGTGTVLYNTIINENWIDENYEVFKKKEKEKEERKIQRDEKNRIEVLRNEYENEIEEIILSYEDLEEEDKQAIDGMVEEAMSKYYISPFFKDNTQKLENQRNRLRKKIIRDEFEKVYTSFEEWIRDR